MKKFLIACLFAAAMLCLVCAAHAAIPALTSAEVSAMESLLGLPDSAGQYPAGSVNGTRESIKTFTDEVVSPLTLALEHKIILAEHAEAVDPTVAALQSQLFGMDVDYDNAVVLPLEHYSFQLDYSAARLSVLLDRYYDGTLLDAEAQEARELAANLGDLHNEVLGALPVFRSATAAASASFSAVDTTALSSPALQKSVDRLADAILLDESAKLRADTGSGTFEIMDKHHFGIICSTDGKDTLSGVQVSVTANGKTVGAATDDKGCAKFDLADFGLDGKGTVQIDAIATKSGYRQREWKGLIVKGGGIVNTCMPVDDGTPYFSMMMIEGYDCLISSNLFYHWNYNKTYDLNVRFVTQSTGTPSKFELKLKDVTKLTFPLNNVTPDGNGVFSATIPFNIKTFSTTNRDNGGDRVIFEYYTTTSPTAPVRLESMLFVQAALYDPVSTEISALGLYSPGDLGFNLPFSLSKVFGGDDKKASISLGFPRMKVGFYIAPDTTAFLCIGLNKYSDMLAKLDKDGCWEKRKDEAEAEMQDMGAKAAADKEEDIQEDNASKVTKAKWLGKCSLYISPFAAVSGKYPLKSDDGFILGGYFGLSVTASAKFSVQLPISLPVFISADVSANASLGVGGQIVFRSKSGKPEDSDVSSYKVTGTIQLPIRVTLGLSLGLGSPDIASISLRGYFNFNPTIRWTTDDDATYLLKYGGGLEANIKVLALNFTLPIIDANGFYQPDGQFHHFDYSPNQTPPNTPTSIKPTVQTDYSRLQCPVGTFTGTPVVSAGSNPEPVKPKEEYEFPFELSLSDIKHCRSLDLNTSKQHRMIFYLAETVENGKRKSDLCYGELSDDIKSLTCKKLDNAWNTGNGYVYAYDFDVWYDTDVNVLYTLSIVSLSPDDPNYPKDPTLGLNTVAYINTYQFRNNVLVPVGNTPAAWKVYESTKPIFAPYVYGGGSTVADSNGFYLLGVRDINNGDVTLFGGAVDLSVGKVTELEKRVFATSDYGRADRASLVDMVFDASTYWKSGTDYQFNYYAVVGGETDTTAYDDNRQPVVYPKLSAQTLYVIRKVPSGQNTVYKDSEHCIIHLMDTPEADHCEMVELETSNETGATTNRLTSLAVKANSVEITKRDIDTTVDSFDLCTINGNRCIYWVQNNKNQEDSSKSTYTVMAMMWDGTSGTYSKPFPLVAPSYEPIQAILFDWDATSTGNQTAYGLYARDSVKNAGPAMNIMSMTYDMVTAMDVTGASASTTYMAAGEDGLFKLQVKNTGNTLIAGFDVTATLTLDKSGKTVKYLYHVDTVTEQASYVKVLQNVGNQDTQIAQYNDHAIFRAPCVMDDADEISTKTVDTIYPDPNARGAGARALTTVSTKVAARGIMPDTERLYYMKIRIPEDWDGSASIDLKISDFQTPKPGTMISVTKPCSSSTEVFTQREINTASAALMASNSPALQISPVSSSAVRGNLTRTLHMKKHDMSVQTDVLSMNGTEYLKVQISNEINTVGMAALPKDSRPVLTIKKDGLVVYTHTFARQIGDYGKNTNFTYHLLIPMDTLTHGLPYGELTASVGMSYTSDPRGVDLNTFNNSDSVNGIASRQPAPGPLPVTDDDTPVAAYMVLLFLSTVLTVLLLAVRSKKRES